ncbi:L-threonylcarbamoyladenylate synthase [Nesterenkonia aerolata]|uniref:L-threonylcarbamoyladenylate synthase n=1 Tax=Nesterenkonia aerolata TaxID=3074079 RepID=A0ABU2DSN0_9MICC|nr:L-threonylcarbamoyladenylate synthase [Nesterenkonia sp. LY-0111]MDR8019512.1 L-threonylcarbamoyladenylate synthase [Nesterenkonia sp. LY-0111]
MTRVSRMLSCETEDERTEALAAAVETVRTGDCLVLPTDTVYGIGADAFSPQAVRVLLAAKGRGRSMPPPVLIGSQRVMSALADTIDEQAHRLAEAFWPGALTLILHAQPSLAWDLGETRGTVALRMPADDLALELLTQTGPLAVSSANRTSMAAATTAEQAQQMLGESVELYLDDGPRQTTGASTIVDCTVSPLRVVRQGAISLSELRTVVPDILGVAEQPQQSREEATGGAD